MKLTFTKIDTSKDYLEVSFDDGHSWTTYDKATILKDGITFTDEQCSDIEQIRFKGGIKKTENIDVKYSLSDNTSDVSGFYYWSYQWHKCYTLSDKPSVGDICMINDAEYSQPIGGKVTAVADDYLSITVTASFGDTTVTRNSTNDVLPQTNN